MIRPESEISTEYLKFDPIQFDNTNYNWYYEVIIECNMPISGKDMLRRFERAGWTVKAQRGSHVKIEKNGQIEIIPLHRELKKELERKLLKRLRE